MDSNKNDLIKNLKWSQKIINDIIFLTAEYHRIGNYKDDSQITKYLEAPFGLSFCTSLGFIFLAGDNIFELLSIVFDSSPNTIDYIVFYPIILICLFIISFFIYRLIYKWLKLTIIKEKETSYLRNVKNELADLKNQINQKKQSLKKATFVPVAYLYPEAINAFLAYLYNKRADTLKECINLYEEECRHNQSMNALSNIEMSNYRIEAELQYHNSSKR